MPPIINLYEAKTHLSKLVDQAASGQDVILARHGKPVARITTLEPGPTKPKVQFGLLKGQISIPENFEAPDPEIEAMFYGTGNA